MGDVRKPEPKKKYKSAGKAIAKKFDELVKDPLVSPRTRIKIDKEYGGTHYGKDYRDTLIKRKFLGKGGMQGSTDASRSAKAAQLEDRVQKQEFRGGGMVGRRGKDRK